MNTILYRSTRLDNPGAETVGAHQPPGAEHTYQTCVECETTPGQYGDTLATTYDYIDGWLGQSGRFIA